MTFHQCGYRFVSLRRLGRMKPFPHHSKFCVQRKKRRNERGQKLGWNHEHQTIGHWHQLAFEENVSFTIWIIGTDELIGKPKAAAEVSSPGLLGKKGIRPSFDQGSVHPLTEQHASEALAGFVKHVFQRRASSAAFFEGKGGGQSGDPAADNCDTFHATYLVPSSTG